MYHDRLPGSSARLSASGTPCRDGTAGSRSKAWRAAIRTLAQLTILLGAKLGANIARHPPTLGRAQPQVIAGSRHTRRRLALSGDGPALYGMQKVRGSSPLSSTLSFIEK